MKASLTAALIAFVGYAVTARYVGNAYPFSTFPMYSEPSTSGSRVAIRTADGALHEWSGFEAFDFGSSGPPTLAPRQCEQQGRFYSIGYLDRDAEQWFREHLRARGAHAEPIEVVRRIWRFSEDGTTTEDCALGAGWAVRR